MVERCGILCGRKGIGVACEEQDNIFDVDTDTTYLTETLQTLDREIP